MTHDASADLSVSVFRDHSAEGWFSMDRYADRLTAAILQIQPGLQLVSPKPPDPWNIPRGMLISRMLRYPLWARKYQNDVNHVTDHSYGHLLYTLNANRSVVTVHDIAPLIFPGHLLGISGLLWRISLSGALRAARIITGSEFTRREVLKRFSLSPDAVTTIYYGVEPGFHSLSEGDLQRFLQRYAFPDQPLLLHVGNTQPRKNLEGLIDAMALLHRRAQPVHLLQAGGSPSPKQIDMIQAHQLGPYIHFLGQVTERDLVGLYNAVDIFVFPSIYEGFGFPPLEAMACGTPVIAGQAASLPEVVGDAGILVPPQDTNALADSIEMILTAPALAEEYSDKGRQRARQFSWEKTAEKTLQVYLDIAP